MTITYKHIILFPIRGEHGDRIINYADAISVSTGIEPPYKKLVPHVTFHRPIAGIDEDKLIKYTCAMTAKAYQTRMRYSGIDCFGKNYIVLPMQATAAVAHLWSEIMTVLSTFPEYEHGPYDHDNTLHVSLAGGIHEQFDRAWPHIMKLKEKIEARDILVDCLEIHHKPTEGGSWELVESFPLDPRPIPTPA